jgi:hypothetical protein
LAGRSALRRFRWLRKISRARSGSIAIAIRSLNRDLPYNQFIIDQIGGDLLPNPHARSTGGDRLPAQPMINEEGGVDS